MQPKSCIDLILQRGVSLVAVPNAQLVQKGLAFFCATKLSDDLRAPRFRELGEGNPASIQASLDCGIRSAVCRERELANTSRVELLEGVKPLAKHRPRALRLAGLLEQPIPGKQMHVRIRGELDLLKVDETIASFDDDVIQTLRRFVFVIALEFHPSIASRCVEPIAKNLEALTVLIYVPSRSDCSFFDIF